MRAQEELTAASAAVTALEGKVSDSPGSQAKPGAAIGQSSGFGTRVGFFGWPFFPTGSSLTAWWHLVPWSA